VTPAVLLLFLSILPPALAADVPLESLRYELGRRLRAFESAFEARRDDPGARRAVAPHLIRATTAFFALRFSDAGRAIDEARLALERGVGPAAPAALWASGICAIPERRLADAASRSLRIRVATLYEVSEGKPARPRLRIGFDGAPGAAAEGPLDALPSERDLPLEGLGEGDRALRATVLDGGEKLAEWAMTVSLARAPRERLAAMEERLAKVAETGSQAESVRSLVRLLKGLLDAPGTETDLPAVRLLAEAEEATKAVAAGEAFWGGCRPGESWIRLRAGDSLVPARILVPRTAREGKPVPLVLALHGMGGSENLFFDGYGLGAAARLAGERGWIIVSPRSGILGNLPVEAVVAEVSRLWPVDPRRVVVVGHSMGAGQAVLAAARSPKLFAAVAVLGGGYRPRDPKALRDLPVFVGVGTRDFALRSARGLERSLREAGAARVTFREYDDVEHLAVVQVALPDVFAFFDRAVAADGGSDSSAEASGARTDGGAEAGPEPGPDGRPAASGSRR